MLAPIDFNSKTPDQEGSAREIVKVKLQENEKPARSGLEQESKIGECNDWLDDSEESNLVMTIFGMDTDT